MRAWLLTLLVCMSLVGTDAAVADEGASVRVRVQNIRNQKGDLRCALFAREASFPDSGATAVRVQRVQGNAPECLFPGLPPGTYAVSVHHDENGDGTLNKNFFGVPSEGYGASNNRTYAMSAPKWSESTFAVAAGSPRVVNIQLRY